MQGEEAIVKCGTSKGPIVMQLHRDWSPNGYDRATELFEKGYYDGSHFYRVVPGFLVQFGITYSQDENLLSLMHKTIPDDPQLEPRIPFGLGTVSFAGSGPNSRKSQLFISYKETSKKLGTELWETPLGTVIHGMEHVQQFYSYGDMPPSGNGPRQGKIHKQGPEYINEEFPLTDRFETCTVQRMNIGHENNKGKNHVETSLSNQESSSSFRINNPTKRDSSISSALAFSSAKNDGIWSARLGGPVVVGVVVVCIGFVIMAVRSRRKTMNKTS